MERIQMWKSVLNWVTQLKMHRKKKKIFKFLFSFKCNILDTIKQIVVVDIFLTLIASSFCT